METQTNNLDPGRTVNYTYDALNRLTSGATQATSGADCWGQAVPSGGYDQYGNLSKINVSQCSAPALNLSVNAGNNQFNSGGFGYDLAGNMTGDGLYSYAWNGAGLLKSAAGVTYTYDGNGNRVEKSSGVFYWRGVDGNVLAETDTSGNPLNEYVFFAGGRIARVDASGNVYYYFQDMLGSDVAITNATGTLCYDADFYLFGGEKAPFTNTCAQNYKFTDMERDGETGLDHTLFRQYSSQYGRWMSPDPAGLGAASLANPQSWNMYSYVTNNPTTFTDPLGLDQCSDYLSSNQCQGVTGGVWSNGCDSFDPPWWCLCEEMGSGDCGPEPAISPIPWWPATPPPTPTVASLGEPSFGWPNGTSIYGGGGGPWSENPGISLNPHLTLNQLLGLPEPQQGCEFGPCEGVPGSTGNASGFQEIGSWNITHPSPQSCAKVKTVAVGGLVVGGGLLAAGALFPLIAPVTDLFGCPTAGVGAVFAVYYAAFCRSGQM